MAILVDYRCPSCGHREEQWSPSPPSATVTCNGCGGDSRRVWTAVGLSGRARPGGTPAAPAVGPRRSICSQYPQVPGLCHMSESAGRMWVAKYAKDGRAVDREHERQEKQATTRPPALADAITHHHRAAPTPVSRPADG